MPYRSWSEVVPFVLEDGYWKELNCIRILDDLISPVKVEVVSPSIYPVMFMPNIKRVIFNDPATIVYWDDGSKTVVKCGKNDTFDKEKGLAMAIIKRMKNNKGNYNDIFRKWIKED